MSKQGPGGHPHVQPWPLSTRGMDSIRTRREAQRPAGPLVRGRKRGQAAAGVLSTGDGWAGLLVSLPISLEFDPRVILQTF